MKINESIAPGFSERIVIIGGGFAGVTALNACGAVA
jgi:heterodisulfide reductase subunit A-like polyferredoxin